MQTQVLNNKTEKIVLSNGTFDSVNMDIIAFSGTTASPDDIDISKLNVRVTLHQGGERKTLYSGNAKPMLMLSSFENRDLHSQVKQDDTKPLLTDGDQFILPLKFNFFNTYNLLGTDKIEFEVRAETVFTGDATSASYIECEGVPTFGIQDRVLLFNVDTVDMSKTKWQRNLGNNVTLLAVMDYEVTDYVAAQQRFSDYAIKSANLDVVLNPIQVLTKNYLPQGLDNTSAYERGHSMIVYSGMELDNCAPEFDKIISNLSANQTHVIYAQSYSTVEIMSRAEELQSRMRAHAESTLGIDPTI